MQMGCGRAAVFLAAIGASGCGAPPPAPPTAVVRAEPASVCLGDAFRTTVRLDASESAPGLALVPVPVPEDAPPLTLLWSFSGTAVQEIGRDPAGVEVLVTVAGDRPLHVGLTVRDAQGGEASTVATVPITLPEVTGCQGEGDCGDGEQCVDAPTGRVCVRAKECDFDADCPVCRICDDTLHRCVPLPEAP